MLEQKNVSLFNIKKIGVDVYNIGMKQSNPSYNLLNSEVIF